MENETFSEMIGLIYDVAFDVDLWPRLLEILGNELETLLADEKKAYSNTADNRMGSIDCSGPFVSHALRSETHTPVSNELKDIPSSELVLINLLRSHFTRALMLSRHISELREEHTAMQELLERLPLGIMIVDNESQVLACNSKLDQIISKGKGTSVTNRVLSAISSTDTARLRQLIRTVIDSDEQESRTINLSHSDVSMPLSALVVPFKAKTPLDGISNSQAVVLVATPEIHPEIPKETLMSLYQLTAAEAKLVSSLVRNRVLKSIAEDFGVSKNTIRTQLKSVYQKTGTHRQAELIRKVITGPAMLATLSMQAETTFPSCPTSKMSPRSLKSKSRQHQTVHLPDNRLLGYAEYGVTDGLPVIFMHSAIGSRLQRHPDETILDKRKVRLIVPDRPGVGLSDERKDMTFLDWADDVEFLAEQLKLKRFNVVGYSGGCAFGLACAYRLRKRIGRLVLASSVAPFNSIWDLEGMSAPYRLFLSLGNYAPSLLVPLVRLIGIQRKPEVFYRELLRQMPPVDRRILSDAAIRDRLIEDMRENLRQGDSHILSELLLMCRYWGFELSDVQVPVELWHGELDRIVPLRLVSRLAAALPNCRTHYISEAGHYFFYSCWEDMLDAAICGDL